MENFLLNMAVIKVIWDKSEADLLDNYMPLLGYAIKICPSESISLPEIAENLNKVAEFKIPQGAVNLLIKRAAKKKYSYIYNNQGIFKKNHAILDRIDYLGARDKVARKHNSLKRKFHDYSKAELNVEIGLDEIDKYFFEVLFELAPQLLSRLYRDDDRKALTEIVDSNSLKYRVYKFVEHLIKNDPEGYEALDSFVRGAILTETFYYSDPLELGKRVRDIQVYFDTQFMLRALGYSDNYYITPSIELIDILRDMKVPMKIFSKTYDEIRGVLYAARDTPSLSRQIHFRPGDAFDYFSRLGLSSSDISLEIVRLEEHINELGINVTQPPPYIERLGVDEEKLNEYIDTFLPTQKEKARHHDIDCLTAIFRLRKGQREKYLESCKAIFITTNTMLAKASTRFFNDEYGVSDAPICMGDHVFTALMWLKAVKKKPDLPKEHMVANCYAAINPADQLWGKYINEVKKLEEGGAITAEDFVILSHTLEAREKLMAITEGEEDVFFEASVPEILEYAKQRLVSEANQKLVEKNGQIIKLNRSMERFLRKISNFIFKVVKYGSLVAFLVILLLGLFFTIPSIFFNIEQIRRIPVVYYIAPVTISLLFLGTVLNLVFGVRLVSLADSLAEVVSNKVKAVLKKNME